MSPFSRAPGLRALVSIGFLPVLAACGGPWTVASAAAVPNPVLLGPVVYVHDSKRAPPSVTHNVPEVSTTMATKDVSTSTGPDSTTTNTRTVTSAELRFGVNILAVMSANSIHEYGLSGGWVHDDVFGYTTLPRPGAAPTVRHLTKADLRRIRDEVAASMAKAGLRVSSPPPQAGLDFWMEPYRASDALAFDSFSLDFFRAFKGGYGESNEHTVLSLHLRDVRVIHGSDAPRAKGAP